MSIQIVEIAQPSVIDTVAVAQPSTVAVVEVRQGVAGEAGPNEVTSATTSDGTADLLLANVETVTAEVTGTLIAPHIHGNLAGSVYAHVRAGEALEKGDPVYISSSHGSGSSLIAEVSKADASNAAKMPAVGIMDADVALHANGHMVITGTITELDTDGLAINAELYVAAGGGLTATPPTARAQPVARVERANANNGAILVKVNGLSASDATPSTLVRRDANGGASLEYPTFGSGFQITETGGTDTFGMRSATADTWSMYGPDYGDSMSFSKAGVINFSPSGFAYAAGAASAHRTALGLGATGSIAASDPLTVTQTWSTNATYTGLQVNVTDSGPSNAASLLMDLQVGGASKAKFRKDGLLTCFAISATSSGSNFASITSSSSGVFLQSGGRLALSNTGFFGFSPSGDATGTLDLQLHRDAASTLAQRNGNGANAAQTFRVYNTYTGGTSFERLNFRWDSNVAKIGTEKGSGGGTARDLVLETDGTERVRVTAAGAVTASGTINATTGNFIEGITLSTGGSKIKDAGNGLLNLTTNSTFSGVTLNVFLDGTLRIRTRGNGADAALTCSNLTASGDIEATDATKGIILKSPDGNRWRVTVDNTGALTTTSLA